MLSAGEGKRLPLQKIFTVNDWWT